MEKQFCSDKKNNEIYGAPERIIGDYKVVFSGENNTIRIGGRCTFKNLIIRVNGDNNLIDIGEGSILVGRIVTAHGNNSLIIGRKLRCNAPCRFHVAEGRKIIIGSNCLFSNVRFRTSDSHSIICMDSKQRINLAADIIVGNNVWISEEVNIYKGVSIGEGSIIGARSTVVKDLPSFSLCAGTPASVLKTNVTWNEKLI